MTERELNVAIEEIRVRLEDWIGVMLDSEDDEVRYETATERIEILSKLIKHLEGNL